MASSLRSLAFLSASLTIAACSVVDTADADSGPDGSGTGGSATTGGAGNDGAGTGGSSDDLSPSTGGGAGVTGGAAGTGGTTSADCSSLPLCDDFESGLDLWTVRTEGGGTVTAEADATRGGQVVKAMGQVAYLQTTAGLSEDVGKIYVRAFMKWGEAVAESHVAYITLGGDDTFGKDLRFGGQHAYLHFNAAQGDGLAPDPFEYPSCATCIAPTPATWACYEVMFDWKNQVASLWVDDVEKYTIDDPSDYHSGATWPTTGAQIRVGHHSFGGSNTMYYDDVAISTARIYCQ